LRTAVTYPAAVALVSWCIASFVVLDALAASLERAEFESASQPHLPGDRIQGYLAKPEGAGPFPAVVGLHGCAGMPDTTKRKLADEFVAWGYVILLVDSFATRGIDQACTFSGFSAIHRRRISDAYGALAFLAGQAFVDPQRVAAVGFSQGGWVALSVAESDYLLKLFVLPSNLRFRAAVAFYPVCRAAGARPLIPTLILTGALDEWTPAADCSDKIGAWGTNGVPIELVVYPSAHHGFYHLELQPGRTIFGRWAEYNGEAANNASLRMQQFLNRYLN
jgi:dienelactone hydrolase